VVLEMLIGGVDVVGTERAADAALLPIGAEHEMLDDELVSALKQVSKRLLALDRVKDICLVDRDPRQLAPLGAQPVSGSRDLLSSANSALRATR
jgi:hypothetical protein